MLADAINLPLLLLYGFITILPLTLVVVVIEAVVMRLLLGLAPRTTFRPLLIANMASTLAGWIVYYLQDAIVFSTGVRTMANLEEGYAAAAGLLIAVYYAKSVLVEGIVLSRRKYREVLNRPLRRFWPAVAAANVASYLLVAPLFYFSTRPVLHGVTLSRDPAALTASTECVYYIRHPDGFLCRIGANGSGQEVVVPHVVRDYVVSADRTAFAFRGGDNNLYYYRLGQRSPTLVWQTDARFAMKEVDISPDNKLVAYLSYQLFVFDTETGRTTSHGRTLDDSSAIAFSGTRPAILYCQWGRGMLPAELDLSSGMFRSIEASQADTLCRSLRRCTWGAWGGRGDWGTPLSFRMVQGRLQIRSEPGLYSSITILLGGQDAYRVRMEHGLIGLSIGSPYEAAFLSQAGMAVCGGGGELYVLDCTGRRLAFLAQGDRFLLDNARFQMSFVGQDGTRHSQEHPEEIGF